MTISERIYGIIRDHYNSEDKINLDPDADSIEKLVLAAYFFGREDATKEVSDAYSRHMAKQTERAKACRYHNMATRVLDNGPGYIPNFEYSMPSHEIFSGDETKF